MNRHRWLVSFASVWAAGVLWGQEAPRPPAPPAPPPAAAPEDPAAAGLARLEAESAIGRASEEAARLRAEADALRLAVAEAAPPEPPAVLAGERAAADEARAEGADGIAGENAARVRAELDALRDSARAESAAGVAGEKAARVRARAEALRELAGIAGGMVVAQARPGAPPAPPAPPVAPAPPKPPERAAGWKRTESPERAYERGQRALDGRRWSEAVEAFTAAASKGGARAEGSAYWKAYALNQLGRREEALEAAAELRKAFPSSRWLEDARILEAEIRQASGQPVRPESETDDDIKLLALNGLIHSEPERAVPLLENLLKRSHAPRLKERALFVLAQSSTPRGKQLLEQVARGGAGNPDLQLKAIRYLGVTGRKGENGALLWELYSGSSDLEVRRAALMGFGAARDKDHLLQIVRTEKTPQLRLEAIGMLGGAGSEAELWQIYGQESSNEVKLRILESMTGAGAAERLLEVARTEKDGSLRRGAVRALMGTGRARAGEALAPLYGTETDTKVKLAILDGMHAGNNAKGLIELARKETDPKLKREIVSRLSHMKSKEASEYLLELLK